MLVVPNPMRHAASTVVCLQPFPLQAITRAMDPTTAMLCQSLLTLDGTTSFPEYLDSLDTPRYSSIEDAVYSGSRWQPNKPRPPQFRRGVSCICMVSDGPPELLGRRALTMMGI